MKKDNVTLLCEFAELLTPFERSRDLNGFLEQAVSMIAWHMRAAVCSIYLLDANRHTLVMRANQGLAPGAVGNVTLKIGEGITGMALKEMRPICVGCASRHPSFKPIPGINEEAFESFLAVPILRGRQRVGVLVIQDPQQNYFDDNDTRAFRAIAAQLATTIQTAQFMLELQQPAPQPPDPVTDEAHTGLVKGQSASEGIAIGRLWFIDTDAHDDLQQARTGQLEHEQTLEDFQRALSATEEQVQTLQRDMEERLGEVAALIFGAHLLILKDAGFSGSIEQQILDGHAPAQAIRNVVDHYTTMFSKSKSSSLQEKVHDIKDLGHRLLHNLQGLENESADYAGHIIAARDILPSEVLRYAAQQAEGLILIGGGLTAHIAILARSAELPAIVLSEELCARLHDGEHVILDGSQGTLILSPDPEVESQFRELIQTQQEAAARHQVCEISMTACGERVHIMANINLLSDVRAALRMCAEGVGLYRSEFPFIVRNDFPSEEEQTRIYRKVVDEMENRSVTFRTLDIGGDKMLSYFPHINESNPFLGLRAIRFTLQNKGLFTDQLRAMLRAAHERSVRIMFPMVSSVDDFIEAREVVLECREELQREGLPFNPNTPLGAMMELPSAVEVAEELAREADFLSIGSNDLVQYMLAVDRTNDAVSSFYVAHHPAVLRALNRVVKAALNARIPISLCGDMAGDRQLLPFLLGIGLRTFSVNARRIPDLQDALADISIRDAEKLAADLLPLGRVREVAEKLAAYQNLACQ